MTTDSCLHCHEGDKVQVSCDVCHAFICVDCHWCHEFQANHEIRVCDRCDSFLCKECEDMDQCHDCGEVVCKSCGTLLTCKFCGSALCEECATACAKCGIVLCGRDAKFAVDCDTCKLSYCLVCLASGQKETCIRCHARPSKRMEQLVHLRLKSIYKAFQQSARTNDAHPHLKRAALAAMKSNKEPKVDPVVAKAQADAAAAELLAELEQEEDSKPTAKKKRKKKKKGQEEQGMKDAGADAECETNVNNANVTEEQSALEVANSWQVSHAETCHPKDDHDDDSGGPIVRKSHLSMDIALSEPNDAFPAEIEKSAPALNHSEHSQQVDPMQTKLCELVNAEDIVGIEELLEEWKGVPGMATVRKNAKKALRRLKDQKAGQPQPRLKVISSMTKSPTTRETVMEMDPSIVGFVIGKGGQKIRDLMDESGAKVWIDQESMGTHEPRIAYVSGAKKAVDIAVKMIQDMVKDADNLGTSVASVTESTEPHVIEQQERRPSEPVDVPIPPGWIRTEIPCEPRFVPLLIGRRGWTIKHIQDSSGAKVDIDQSVTPRIVSVVGSAESVQTAKRLICDVLSYPHAQLKTDVDDPDLYAVDGKHSPPPSTYVMTGDVKSIVSASSSLSSTPEPSMASSKGREVVMPPPGLFDNNRRSEGVPLAQRYVQMATQYSGEPVLQPHCANMHQSNQQQPTNMRQAQTIPSQGHHIGGVGQQQQVRGPPPMIVQQPVAGLPSAHLQHQQHAMHHQLNQQHMQGGMHMSPVLISQHQLAVQQQQMAMAQQQHIRSGFLSSHGNPNEAGMRFGTMGQQHLAPSVDQSLQSVDLPFFGGGSGQSLLCQPQPNSLLHPAFESHAQQNESMGFDLIGNSGSFLPPASLPVPIIPPTVSRQSKDIFPRVAPLATSGSKDESNLIDSMFAGGPGNSLLDGLKGLNVTGDNWEGSSGIPSWDREEKSRLLMQQPNESRFQWGS